MQLDDRKWYEKIRYSLPALLFPTFLVVFFIWYQYPNILAAKDNASTTVSTPSSTSTQTNPSAQNLEKKSEIQSFGEKYGTYGDSYGSLNTLFTGFAFAGLIISIFIQLLEMRQTRKELLGQKVELENQSKILERQVLISEKQQEILNEQHKENERNNFRNEFYKLIEQRNVMLNSLNILDTNGNSLGSHDIFYAYCHKFASILKSYGSKKYDSNFFEITWDEFSREHFESSNFQLQLYLNMFNTITHIIDTSNKITEEEKIHYFKILVTFVGLEEAICLMWNGIFSKKVKYACDTAGLFSNVSGEILEPLAKQFYKPSAFRFAKEWEEIFEKNNADEV